MNNKLINGFVILLSHNQYWKHEIYMKKRGDSINASNDSIKIVEFVLNFT